MKTNRRSFLSAGIGTSLAVALPFKLKAWSQFVNKSSRYKESFDPWIEILPDSLEYNVKQLHLLSGNRPILAVVKNNGYGLGAINVARSIEIMPEIYGFADVKAEACLELRESGIKKPILLMGLPAGDMVDDLVAKGIQIAVYNNATLTQLNSIAHQRQLIPSIQIYVDTGMSRMGVPYQKALTLIEKINSSNVAVIGSFMGFTEDPEFDREQLERFTNLSAQAQEANFNMGKLHAASSNAIFHYSDAALDLVRPGMSIYGGYPSYFEKEKAMMQLKVSYRLQARIVRVEQLRAGDTVSYGREYKAEKPIWIATLPIGHADGYLRKAAGNARVLVNDQLYPVIGAVSASHTILEIGEEQSVKVGDNAILVGPDHEEIHPNYLSESTGVSVYDILMHMSSKLPKYVV